MTQATLQAKHITAQKMYVQNENEMKLSMKKNRGVAQNSCQLCHDGKGGRAASECDQDMSSVELKCQMSASTICRGKNKICHWKDV